jgi:hypothetical protein
MVIPEAQLLTWSGQGSVAGSATAYASIGAAIDASGLKRSHGIDVFLQGSYRNSTNIAKESDVDVVVNCHDTFYSYKGLLEGVELAKVNALAPATYGWNELRADVKKALVAHYGPGRVTDKTKCLLVTDAGGTGISADVVPAFDYRYYYQDAQRWLEGIAFFRTDTFDMIVGFPKYHYENGVRKSESTKQEFKPSVRVFKNAAVEMVDRALLSDGDAPSYFIECLIYDVPDEYFFGSTWQDQVARIYNWLEKADKSQFMCVNGVYRLFGSGQWTTELADRFIRQFPHLWNNW